MDMSDKEKMCFEERMKWYDDQLHQVLLTYGKNILLIKLKQLNIFDEINLNNIIVDFIDKETFYEISQLPLDEILELNSFRK